MAFISESSKKIAYDMPQSIRLLNKWKNIRNNRWGIGLREIFGALGPGFLISVGYMDPGNWGTNLAAGAGFGYQLLWVILVSNVIAIFLQISSAKLGIATGKNLAQLIREQFPRPIVIFLGITTAIAIMATDVAEVLGGALGFNILFHIPLFLSALITGVIVMALLGLSRWGFRKIEFVIIALVSVIGLVYVYEMTLVHPGWSLVAQHLVIPQVTSASILTAVSILSQAILSLQLPFTMVPVVLLTRRRDLMEDFVNGHLTNIMNVCITLVVTVLNMLLLYTLFWG